MEEFELRCLGQPVLLLNGMPLKFEMRKSLAMLIFLRTMARDVSREYLEALFWPDYDQKSAQANLRRSLSSLKKTLKEPLLEINREKIGLDFKRVTLDLENLHSILSSAREHGHGPGQLCRDCLQKLEEAERLYKGDFMEGFNLRDCPEFDEWQFSQREASRAELASILPELGRTYVAQAEWDKAIQYTRRWANLDPLNEPAQRLLIQSFAQAGQLTAALHQYEVFSKALRVELDQSPSEETTALLLQIQKGRLDNEPAEKESSAPQVLENAAGPLIRTKLFAPLPRSNRVYRSRLQELLEQASQFPLTLISAPAGYGKTTLLAEWIQDCRKKVGGDGSPGSPQFAWLSLDADDNDPSRFLAYLVETLVNIQPKMMAEAQWMHQSPRGIPSRAILTRLVNALQELSFPLWLVLDDYQSINNPAIHEYVAFLVDHRPEPFHLVISTRANPPLPLHRLRARNQLLELRARDLRFTSDEATSFLNKVMDLSLTGEDIAILEDRTEGWIAGLQMAALSLQDQHDRTAFIRKFGGSHRFILEYLIEEILKRQTPEIQSFLLQTSILDRICQPLCDAVLEDSDTGQVKIREIELSNLFLSPLDEIGNWYRYHHLFADLLRARLSQVRPGLIPELHLRASLWYEKEGLPIEAINHALAAHNLERAARLLEVFTMDIMERGEMSVLLGYIRQLPQDIIRNHPGLAIQYAWVLAFSGQIEQVEPLLILAESSILPGDGGLRDREIQGNVTIIRGLVADFRGEMDAAIQLARQADACLSKDSWQARSVVYYVLGDAYYARGDLELADQEYEKIRKIGQASGNLWINEEALFKKAQVKKLQGKLRAAYGFYQEVIALAKEKMALDAASMAATYIGISDLQREWNQLDDAQRTAQQAIDSMAHWPNSVDLVNGYLSLTRTSIAQGQMTAAEETLQKAEECSAKGNLFPTTWRNLEACRLRLWLAKKDVVTIRQWVEKQPLDELLIENLDITSALDGLGLARALIALNGDWTGKALSLLKRIEQSIRPAGQITLVIEMDTLLALAFGFRGETQTALMYLKECLMLTQSEGYLRQYLNEGETMRSMLMALRTSKSMSAGAQESDLYPYLDRILSAFPSIQEPQVQSKTRTPPTLIEPLSLRELEVLSLICKGYSNQEIAIELVVTTDTVKKHNNRIFGKLGVTNRVQAVLQAKKLGLAQDPAATTDE